MSLRSQNKVSVYNCGNELMAHLRLSVSDAQAEVSAGNAHWLRSKRDPAIQLTQWDRFQPTPSGLPASTMQACAGGAVWARAKVREWGRMQQANIARLVVRA